MKIIGIEKGSLNNKEWLSLLGLQLALWAQYSWRWWAICTSYYIPPYSRIPGYRSILSSSGIKGKSTGLVREDGIITLPQRLQLLVEIKSRPNKPRRTSSSLRVVRGLYCDTNFSFITNLLHWDFSLQSCQIKVIEYKNLALTSEYFTLRSFAFLF